VPAVAACGGAAAATLLPPVPLLVLPVVAASECATCTPFVDVMRGLEELRVRVLLAPAVAVRERPRKLPVPAALIPIAAALSRQSDTRAASTHGARWAARIQLAGVASEARQRRTCLIVL